MITACGDLFDIDSNAAGMTASERAQKVQSNLDNALVAARDEHLALFEFSIHIATPSSRSTMTYRHS